MKSYEQSIDVVADLMVRSLGRNNVKTVVELGARDCNESVACARHFPEATVYAFECNPATLPSCRQRTKQEPNIHLIERAVTDRNDMIPFYPTNREKTVTTWKDGNPGASSVLKASGKYTMEQYVQDEITVQSVTLKTFMEQSGIESIDLLWMDIQGAELMALKGLSERIMDVKVIHTEVEFLAIYENQPLFKDIKQYLNGHEFLFAGFTNKNEFFADAVFLNSSCIKSYYRRILLRLLDRYYLHASMSIQRYIMSKITWTRI